MWFLMRLRKSPSRLLRVRKGNYGTGLRVRRAPARGQRSLPICGEWRVTGAIFARSVEKYAAAGSRTVFVLPFQVRSTRNFVHQWACSGRQFEVAVHHARNAACVSSSGRAAILQAGTSDSANG